MNQFRDTRNINQYTSMYAIRDNDEKYDLY